MEPRQLAGARPEDDRAAASTRGPAGPAAPRTSGRADAAAAPIGRPAEPAVARLPAALDRRGFLRATAGGATAAALASLLPAGCAADYPQAGADEVVLQALTPKEYAVLRAAAEALLGDVPVPAARVAARVDGELAAVGDPMRADMKTVLGLLQHLTLLGGRLRRFTALDAEARLAYLGTWARSRFGLRRAAYQAVRAFVYMFAYADDATRPLTGFEGPWPERGVPIPPYPVDFGEVR